jgi:RNA polymerase sigma factor (sigma-70 family)
MSQREIPFNFLYWPWDSPSLDLPESETQALMETAPGDEPRETVHDLQKVREAVADCLEQISEQAQFVINAYEAERLSYSQLGERLGVSTSHAERLHKKAHEEVAELLKSHPVIQERYNL